MTPRIRIFQIVERMANKHHKPLTPTQAAKNVLQEFEIPRDSALDLQLEEWFEKLLNYPKPVSRAFKDLETWLANRGLTIPCLKY